MPTIKLTETARIALLTERVKGVLLMNLPPAGLEAPAVLELLADYGLVIDAADLPAVRDALVADGTLEIIP